MSNPMTATDEWWTSREAAFAGLREVHIGWCQGCTMSIWRCDEVRRSGDTEGCCASCDHYTQGAS